MGKLNKKTVFIVLRDGVIIALACTVISLVVNAVRPDGIPLVQKEEYNLFVPCPEPIGEVERMSGVDFMNLKEEKVFIIDARSKNDFKAWHHPEAINIPFDYLMPVCTVSLKEIASSGARMVVVYGDGKDPDSGKELGRELSGSGIKNVYYVEGGETAIRWQESRGAASHE